MLVYSLSPRAYEGLVELAQDSVWCRDYSRILRYLEATVTSKEAMQMSHDGTPNSLGWREIAFLEETEHLTTPR